MKEGSSSNIKQTSSSVYNSSNYDFASLQTPKNSQKPVIDSNRESTNLKGMNIIYNSDINNFIHEFVGSKSPQETTGSLRASLKSVNASASNVKFGKLTLNRGPSKDKIETKPSVPAESK